jgi:hydrophobic/amphiphilic exporter-1 (mainly G- bacteria), HAE1 family
MGPVEWGIRNPVTINLIVVISTIFGLLSTAIIRRELYPQVQKDTVIVTVTLNTTSTPVQVDQNIVQVLLPGIQNVNGIDQSMTSATTTQAQITIDVKAGFDPYIVKADVEDQVNAAANNLPKYAEPPLVTVAKPTNFALYVVITGENADEWDLANAANALASDMIDQGIATSVVTQGVPNYEIAIEIPNASLQAYGLSMADVALQVQSFDSQLDAGQIYDPRGYVLIKAPMQKRTERAFAHIPIHLGNNEYISLGQLAGQGNITNLFVQDPAIGRYNDVPAAFVQVSTATYQDLIRVCNRVKKYVANYGFPSNITPQIAFDMSPVIESRLALIFENGIEGIILVLLLLAAFVEWKIGLWVSMGILFSLTGAMSFLFITGQTLNMMSLTGFLIAVGVVVDNGLVIGEGYAHHRERGVNSFDASRFACKELFFPVLAMGLANIIVYIPLLCIIGQDGKLIRGIPIVTMAALALSLVQALIILPPHLAHYGAEVRTLFMVTLSKLLFPLIWLSHKVHPHTEKGLNYVHDKWLVPSVRFCVTYRYATIILFLAIFYITYAMIPIGVEPIEVTPPQETNFYMAQVQFQQGTSSQSTEQAVNLMVTGLKNANQYFYDQNGSQSIDYFITYANQNNGAVVVQLLNPDQGRTATGQQFQDQWYTEMPLIPNVISLNINALGSSSANKSIDFVLYGRDERALTQAARKSLDLLNNTWGTQSVNQSRVLGMMGAELTIAPEFYNLPLSESNMMAELYTVYNGKQISSFYRDNQEVEVNVRATREDRRDLSQLLNYIFPSTGLTVGQMAHLQLQQTLASFQRYQGLPTIEITSDVDLSAGGNTHDITAVLRSEVLDQLPTGLSGVKWAWQGNAREAHKAIVSLTIAVIPTMLFLYLVLATIFKSYVQPVIILLAIPYGLVGVLWGHIIMGYPLSLLSLFGIIALVGLEVNASIVLVDYINQMLLSGRDIMDASLEAVQRRLRPILLTAGTAIIGMFPLLVDSSMNAQYVKPIIISIFFGKLVSTVLCMLLIPSAYAIIQDAATWMDRVREKGTKQVNRPVAPPSAEP